MPRYKFKELSDDDIKFIKKTHQENNSEERDRIISKRFDITERAARKWISKLELSAPEAEKVNEHIQIAKSRVLEDKKFYIITSAQNATPVHKQLLENIKEYAIFLDAAIHVIPYRYKNPTSVHTDMDNDYWDLSVVEFLDMNRHSIHKNLQLLSDVKIQPTASNPLQGLQGLTGHQSCIVGHPKMQLQSKPTLESYHDKIMCTTGACTIENYTDSKAGKRGEFHHIFGFVIVEVRDNDIFYMRQVCANEDGNFIDINNKVENGAVSKIATCKGWRLGDIHVRSVDHGKIAENMRVMSKLVPEKIVLDDIFDGETVNPHTKDDHVLRVKMAKNGQDSIQDEIDEMILWLQEFSSNFSNSEIVITKSNHDVFADRFANYANWKKDYHNAETILDLQRIAIDDRCTNGIIPFIISMNMPHIRCLGYNESYVIGNTECSQHGQFGANGSRGSAEQFRNMSMKMCTAHSHSISRLDGLITVGTSTKKRLSYTNGASGWIHADVIFDKYDKSQQLIFMKDYKFTTFFD